MRLEIVPSVWWIGKVDWELRKFHGEEYSTHRGSSYNSYMVKDERIALMDAICQRVTGNLLFRAPGPRGSVTSRGTRY